MKTCNLLIIFVVSCSLISAQGTFTTVYSLLQSNCSASGCHGGATPAIFSVDGSETDVYNALVGVAASNSTAAAKGNKLIDPGHPYNSFLLKKIGGEFDSYLKLESTEGELEPRNAQPLQNFEIELVRQWILMGARKNSNDVDYQLLKDYYTNGGIEMIPVPQAPLPSEGMQVRFGPIFLAPGEEAEWDKKEHLRNINPVKVFKTDGYMSWQSHHMLLFKYDDDGSDVREGMRRVPSEATPFNGNVTLTGAWQNDAEFELPANTAFFWGASTILEFDYHIKNYSETEILPSDFYLNIYFDTENTRNIEMHAELVNNLALILFQGENTRIATHNFNEERYIYMVSSHTHKWGTDFDIYLRNPDGTRGTQIYEGFFNEQYTFNQGYYDWQHPPIRYFTPMQKATDGLIYEAKWNVGMPFVTFGLTADDEMMLFTYMYTKEEVAVTPASIQEAGIENNGMSISPNPFTADAEIRYAMREAADVQIEMYNLVGKRISILLAGKVSAGNHVYRLNSAVMENRVGIYFVNLRVNGESVSTQKVSRF
ncbi:MAG TPA: T9SS type A sorting domain-containing protein [Chitinophagales bacterium]|nr:T9SS type A sorting domain-containing protein [Chitinophagales bacterium]